MDVPVASSSSNNSTGINESDSQMNSCCNFMSCFKSKKIDSTLQPAEKLFIHCCTIFILSFRCLAAKKDTIYSDKFTKFMDIMADVCSLSSFNERERDRLLTVSQNRAQSFSYYLHISLISTDAIEKIASRGTEDRVFLAAEYVDSKGKPRSKTMQLFQFAANGKWLPYYNYITKKKDSLMLPLSHFVVDNDQTISLKLLIVKAKSEICPLKGSWCSKTQSMLIVTLNPSQIYWNGVVKSFPVSETPPGLPTMRLKMKLKWALKPKLARGGYNLFRKSWKLHDQLLVRFFHYRWRKRANLQSSHAECQRSKQRAAMVPMVFEEDLPNLYWDDPIKPSNLDFTSPLCSKFCCCSEWCSIYAFYNANPIVRFVVGQNQNFFLVPDTLIIPYHFKSICTLINLKNFYCPSMFASILRAVYFYINSSLKARAGHNEEAFWRNKGARILAEGYWLLRDWFVRPESFTLSKHPFDDYPDSVKYFADSLTWLSKNLKNISDMKLNTILETVKSKTGRNKK